MTAGLWNTGSSVQLAVTAVWSVNTNAANITAVVSGANLNLSWPSDHIGWRLLAQTNHLASGLSSNTNDWGTVAGSAGTNQVSIPLPAATSTEYYRLVYP